MLGKNMNSRRFDTAVPLSSFTRKPNYHFKKNVYKMLQKPHQNKHCIY